jgi:hypothetical protein
LPSKCHSPQVISPLRPLVLTGEKYQGANL